jgi:hypothetical protein
MNAGIMIKNILQKKTGEIIKVGQKKTTAFITVVVLLQLYKLTSKVYRRHGKERFKGVLVFEIL